MKFFIQVVLKIHLIWMRIRIWILDPHWEKVDPDPGYFFKGGGAKRITLRKIKTVIKQYLEL